MSIFEKKENLVIFGNPGDGLDEVSLIMQMGGYKKESLEDYLAKELQTEFNFNLDSCLEYARLILMSISDSDLYKLAIRASADFYKKTVIVTSNLRHAEVLKRALKGRLFGVTLYDKNPSFCVTLPIFDKIIGDEDDLI